MLSPVNTSPHSPISGGHLAFLRRIARDDEFRARLENDPQKAMAECGLQVDPVDVPAKVTLPREEAILKSFVDVDDDSGWDKIVRWSGFFGR